MSFSLALAKRTRELGPQRSKMSAGPAAEFLVSWAGTEQYEAPLLWLPHLLRRLDVNQAAACREARPGSS